MNLRIRKVKTGSGKIAVQVFRMNKGKREILKHLGSADKESDIAFLTEQANNWIKENTLDVSLFEEVSSSRDPYFETYKVLGTKYNFAYDFLKKLILKLNLQEHLSPVTRDLIIMQILEPSSKRQSLKNLEKYFGIKHDLTNFYKEFKTFYPTQKDALEKQVIEIAKNHFDFNFSLVLYDVTTLYFESFKNDEFKRPGFSKDNKANQPQIVIGLIVDPDGFPVSYEVFEGNTFEGNTFLPLLLKFKEKYQIQTLTIVADAAMTSKINRDKLKEHHLSYILGARLANQPQTLLDEIQRRIKREDRFSIKIGDLIVEYRVDRYKKDKLDLEKQIQKAKQQVGIHTTKLRKTSLVKNTKAEYYLDTDLIDKKIKLLGLKGYITNLGLPNKKIIENYHNLFKVEHAFRISKSDLEMRPIYHYKENSIKNHILICFVALVISVYLELKNHQSIRVLVDKLMSVTDTEVLNRKTGKILIDRTGEEVKILH